MSNLYTEYRLAVKSLNESGCDGEFDARQLVEYCLGMNKTQMLLNSQSKVDEIKLEFFKDCVKRRCSREPLQYIIGVWGFYKYTFKVRPGVLIPRPETEAIVEFTVNNMPKTYNGVIFDLCSGSGCVGISIAKRFPKCKIFCIDISDEAVSLSKENAELLDALNVTVIKGDIFDGFSSFNLPQPDVIVSNPPYIPFSELETLQAEVKFEPELALDGGVDGLNFYRIIAEKWYPYLSKDGFAVLECGENQADSINKMFSNKSFCRYIKDGGGCDRTVVIKR